MGLKRVFNKSLLYFVVIGIVLLILFKLEYLKIDLAGNNKQILNSTTDTPKPYYVNTQFFNINPIFPNGVYQPRSPEPDPNYITIEKSDSWKTYQSKKIGYEIQIPPNWQGGISEDENDYFKLSVSPETRDGLCQDEVWVVYPFTLQQLLKDKENFYEESLSEIERYYQEKTAQHGILNITYPVVDHKPSLAVSIKDPKPQEGFQGEWCGGDSKSVFIQLGENRFFAISANWNKDTIYNTENLFNQILAKLKFL